MNVNVSSFYNKQQAILTINGKLTFLTVDRLGKEKIRPMFQIQPFVMFLVSLMMKKKLLSMQLTMTLSKI